MGVGYILGLHPVGIYDGYRYCISSNCECFISPDIWSFFRFKHPRKRDYLGFSHLHSFFSFLFAFGLSGFLLDKYCPDPRLFINEAGCTGYTEATLLQQNAHYIWYVFVGIGLFLQLHYFI